MASIGELLEEANQRARDLLHEAPDRDGTAMVRSWAEVVEAAAGLWRAIPGTPHQQAQPRPEYTVMDQLEAHVRTLHRQARAGTSLDADLQIIGGLFTRAQEALEAANVRPLSNQAARRDAFAGKVSIMHTLYITGHAVSLGLRNSQERLAEGGSGLRRGVDLATDLALSYHQGAYPDALSHTRRNWADPDLLGHTVSAWDIKAHRTLAGASTGRDVETLAGTALVATSHARVLWRLAHESGHADARDFRARIGPALEASGQEWARLHAVLRPLVHPTERPDVELLTASTDLRCALGQLANDRLAMTGKATPASLVDLSETTNALRRLHTSTVGIAAGIAAAMQRGAVSVNALTANRLVRNLGQDIDLPKWLRSSVDPRSVYLKRPEALPEPLRGPLAEIAHSVGRSCARLQEATAMSLHRPTHTDQAAPGRGDARRPDRTPLREIREVSRASTPSGMSR